MAIDINQFEKIKDKARKLIKEDAKNDSHIIKERQMDRERTYRSLKGAGAAAVTGFENIAPSYGSNGVSMSTVNEAYSDDNDNALYNAMDGRMKQFMESRNNVQMTPAAQNPTPINTALPREILESFSEKYIDQSAFDPNKSVLEKMGIVGNNQPAAQQESVQNYQPQAVNAKVDYELIKNIVESTVKKYVGALSKKMLTENKVNEDSEINAIQFTGKKFVFVTKGGDMYESGNLKFIKNVNAK